MELHMPQATFVLVDGTRKSVQVAVGQSLMSAAKKNGLDDIVAECGGALTCASCHVMVEPEFQGVCPPLESGEDQMLDFVASERTQTSRLSCQLVMTEDMDGIVVHIADRQIE